MPPRPSLSAANACLQELAGPRVRHCDPTNICNSFASRHRLLRWSNSNPPTAPFSTCTPSRALFGPRMASMPANQRAQARRQEQQDDEARAMEKNFTREWKAGDIYAPHDLSGAEARKWKRKPAPTRDAFDALSMNPLDCYKVISCHAPSSRFITD